MRILTLDIGTGTQDILLFDSSKTIENCASLVMPAPTVIAAGRVRQATAAHRGLALTGVTMGGGPVTGAVQEHIAAGLPVFATPGAATTFDDDLEMVRAMGVTLVGEDEIGAMDDVAAVELRDLDLERVRRALEAFDEPAQWDALAVAVFDHGNAPPGYSDRRFRFDHLRQQMVEGRSDVRSFCYLRDELPEYVTRMLAVARCTPEGTPLLLMDTAQDAVVGALEDREVAGRHCKIVVNVGNEHTLAFHLHGAEIQGLFEHHTGVLTAPRLEEYLRRLAHGGLDGEEVWRGQGHGAITVKTCGRFPFLAVTGPQRRLLEGSTLQPYFATPLGDMMLTGCFGLLRAWAGKRPNWKEEIMAALRA